MKIPSKTCITLATCKHKKEISCSILVNHYFSHLRENEPKYYKQLLAIMNHYKIHWIYVNNIHYSNNKYDNRYADILRYAFPILDTFLVLKKHINQKLFSNWEKSLKIMNKFYEEG